MSSALTSAVQTFVSRSPTVAGRFSLAHHRRPRMYVMRIASSNKYSNVPISFYKKPALRVRRSPRLARALLA
jgi:hypothetical protein